MQLDLATVCLKAGLKNVGTMFLMTDAQVPDEKFLVLINDLLASGEIPDLFPDDEIENIIGGVRNEVKGQGLQDTRENCWKFFIERLRRQLKVLSQDPLNNILLMRDCECIRAVLQHRGFTVNSKHMKLAECLRHQSKYLSVVACPNA